VVALAAQSVKAGLLVAKFNWRMISKGSYAFFIDQNPPGRKRSGGIFFVSHQ